ncbi:KICSTOR complex protein kaptin-like [Daktulosphaira vitifoliae]|uniref:KICSTOR complex protein kaptin-like n=1 Tax=Daktulosphaira vitifoliae TaxID=58002 RepID=UPI0021AA71DE|nr:KICSTOR complex protein kaptin-like [Daktulosphaira vitifoliae]
MWTLTESSFFPMPSQGNIYSSSVLTTVDGSHKILIAFQKKKIITLEPGIEDGEIEPIAKELKFSNIPSNVEIISIHLINKSKTCNHFAVGITYLKIIGDDDPVSYLNIYSGSQNSALETITQNCEVIQLSFIPYQLNHGTYLKETPEVMWLLSGSDGRIHAYNVNEPIQEQNILNYFVEYQELADSTILCFDTKSFNNYKKRVSFFGCESGYTMFSIVDTTKNQILHYFYEHYQFPVSVMKLFNLNNKTVKLDNILTDNNISDSDCIDEKNKVCLLITNAVEPSLVYMNVLEDYLGNMIMLTNSDSHDAIICATAADVNFDSINEILLGSYGHSILIYTFKGDKWLKEPVIALRYPINGLWYLDITNQGVKDLIVISERGIHIFKHDPRHILDILKKRLKTSK